MSEPAAAPQIVVGSDIAAVTVAAVWQAAGQPAQPARTFDNAADGWAALREWLARQGAAPATAALVMEAPGAHWQGLATALVEHGWAVSVVSPSSVHHYARARLRRAKTDAVDAAIRAAYGWDRHPAPWVPAPAEVQALQPLIRQRDDLAALQTETGNRQHALGTLPAAPP